MNKEEILEKLKDYLIKAGARKILVFGSFARGETKPESDIDLIVEFNERKSLLDIVGLEQELTEILGIKVDLLTEKSISPYILDKIKNDLIVVYQ